ncbi:NAD(P)H-dependent oxidoreductase [Candidatus Woesearchaeota archaeon]|nr:NAD(P)H-dependent oxidoreductase [Candidatus Woesearchaeota archaeon]
MDFDKIVMERYATKLFDGRKIPEDKLNRLLEIIRYSASSFNIQPWKIIVVKDQKLKEKLQPATWNQQQIPTCSHLLVFCADTEIAGNIDRLEKLMIENGADKESIKGYIDMMKGFENGLNAEQKLSWAQRQTFLALGNALNGAKFLGFDSCPMEGFNPKEYSRILNLPKNLVPTALCPIGYAKDKAKDKLRFAEKDVFIEDSKLKW